MKGKNDMDDEKMVPRTLNPTLAAMPATLPAATDATPRVLKKQTQLLKKLKKLYCSLIPVTIQEVPNKAIEDRNFQVLLGTDNTQYMGAPIDLA
jgi:hypothetical protein